MSSSPVLLSRRWLLVAGFGAIATACGTSSNEAATGAATDPVAPLGPTGSSTDTSLVSSDSAPSQASTPSAPSGVDGLRSAVTVSGDSFDVATVTGRPLVAWFWAPWCVICRGEAPDVIEVAAAYADKVAFVGVAGRGTPDEMTEFIDDTATQSIVHLDDADGSIWAWYEVYTQPAYAFVTADGRMEVFNGALGKDGLIDVIDKLLAA